jgi:hypothetical protein
MDESVSNSNVHRARDDVHARESWHPCGARTRAGAPCRRRGTGIGGRCPNHGGLNLGGAWAERRWKLLITSSSILVEPETPSRRRPLAFPQPVSWRIALELVVRGRIQHATLHRRLATVLLAEVKARGVRVTEEAPPSPLVRRVVFDASVTVHERQLRNRKRGDQ